MLQTASVLEVIGDVKTLGASKKWCSGVTCWFAGALVWSEVWDCTRELRLRTQIYQVIVIFITMTLLCAFLIGWEFCDVIYLENSSVYSPQCS